MESNWANFLKNLGEWEGTFTQISTDGELLDSVPSILTLEGLEDNQLIRFRLRRFATDIREEPTSDRSQEYSSLGKQAVFFDTGAFSKGSLQVAPFSEFGAEYGFVKENRRSRLVQLFDKQGAFSSLTLISEVRSGSNATIRPHLTVKQLVGKWKGTAYTCYSDWQDPDSYATSLEISEVDGFLQQQISFGDSPSAVGVSLPLGTADAFAEANATRTRTERLPQRIITSSARIDTNQLHFEDGATPRRILLLPDGVSSNTPLQISHRQPFFVEAGWLLSANERQRLMRNYNEKGEWISSTHIIEHREG
jgi:hypothetical protein